MNLDEKKERSFLKREVLERTYLLVKQSR